MAQNQPTGLCECGCGGLAPLSKVNRASHGYVKGQPKRFIHGHHARAEGNPNFGKTGQLSALWKGDRRIQNGYVTVRVEADHPFISMAKKYGGSWYIAEHRLVMAAHLGRPLVGGHNGEVVHHKLECEGGSGNTSDNRLENLTLFATPSEHAAHHARLRLKT